MLKHVESHIVAGLVASIGLIIEEHQITQGCSCFFTHRWPWLWKLEMFWVFWPWFCTYWCVVITTIIAASPSIPSSASSPSASLWVDWDIALTTHQRYIILPRCASSRSSCTNGWIAPACATATWSVCVKHHFPILSSRFILQLKEFLSSAFWFYQEISTECYTGFPSLPGCRHCLWPAFGGRRHKLPALRVKYRYAMRLHVHWVLHTSALSDRSKRTKGVRAPAWAIITSDFWWLSCDNSQYSVYGA